MGGAAWIADPILWAQLARAVVWERVRARPSALGATDSPGEPLEPLTVLSQTRPPPCRARRRARAPLGAQEGARQPCGATPPTAITNLVWMHPERQWSPARGAPAAVACGDAGAGPHGARRQRRGAQSGATPHGAPGSGPDVSGGGSVGPSGLERAAARGALALRGGRPGRSDLYFWVDADGARSARPRRAAGPARGPAVQGGRV